MHQLLIFFQINAIFSSRLPSLDAYLNRISPLCVMYDRHEKYTLLQWLICQQIIPKELRLTWTEKFLHAFKFGPVFWIRLYHFIVLFRTLNLSLFYNPGRSSEAPLLYNCPDPFWVWIQYRTICTHRVVNSRVAVRLEIQGYIWK